MIHKKNNSGSFLDNAKFKLTGVGTSYNEEKTSSNGGKVLFENLSPGNYTLEEIESPRGYTKSKETWNIKVENNGKTIIGDNTNSGTMDTPILEIINKKETSISEKGKGKFIINKTDGKKALDGAVFELKNNSNQSVIVPSSGEGSSKITFENLDPGTYTLKEKTPPAGYEKTNQEWTVTVDKDGFTKVEEKLSKSKKSRSQSSSERGAEKQFRSADLSSYILPRFVRGLFDSNGFNFININPARAGELDINQLYPRDNSPSPNFSYSEKDVTKNKRKNEKYKSTNEGDWYKYRGRDKYSSTNVAEINKYLVPTDKPGEYEVHLKVRGNTIEEKNSLGIVIVYDHSGSMSLSPNGWNSNSRFEVAKEATEGFLREILNPNNNNVQAALVTFGGDLFDGHNHKEGWYDDYSHFEFTNDPENIINKMPGSPTKPNNQKAGTYTASGLKKAEELLRNSHFDKKVIITITDGIPTFSPAVEYAGIPQLDYGPKYGNGSRFPLDNGSYHSYDGVWIENHGQATIHQAKINKKAGIDMYTVGILIAAEKGATEEDAHNVMRGIANPGKYFNSNKIGDIKKNLDRILVDLNHKTVNEGEINDPLGSQVEYNSNSGYDLKKYRNGIEASDVSTRARVEYDNFNRKFKVSNLILGKDESCELIYKVNLKIEDSNFVSGNMYPTNGKATLKPYGKKDVNWRFPEPAISAKLRDIKLTKKWRKQNGSKPQDGTVTFQLQRKKSAEDDSKYKDVSSQNVTKNISDGDFEHTFKNLPPFNNKGEIYNYRIIETNIPVGYEPTTHEEGDNITITNKEIPEITVVNHPVKRYGKFIIEKEDDKGKPLGGAEFKLTNDKTGKQVEPTSGEGTPKITYEKLEEGSYTLEEVSSPAGYIRTTDKWTVTVDKDGFTRVEKSTKSSKSYSLDSSEESGKRRFRSASPSSYNIPRSLKSLYRGNIIPVSRSGNSMDGLYNKNAQPNPSFTYQDSSSGRTGEKYKNPKITDGFYNYKGNFKGKSVDVAGVNKYLEPTKKPGEYIVHLKVKGNTIKEENKIGVVVVYDNSGSMYTNDRYSKAHTATSKFIRTLLSNENVEAALVTYSNHVLDGEEHYNHKDRDYETVPNACTDGFTSSADTFIKALPKSKNIKAAHGTNTAAALVRARKLLDESGNKYDRKFVIVVTDGAPTYSPMIIDAYDDVSFRPNVEFSSDEKKTKGNGEEYSLKRKSKKEYEKEYKVRHYTINNHGTTCEYACNNLKEKGVEIHTVGIEIDGKKEGIDKKTATDSMKKMSSRDDYYYDTTNVDLLSDNLTKILEKIDMDTIEYGSIEDKIGEKVIFEENSYDIKGFKDGVLDDDITQYVYKNYDKNEKKLTISNLYIGENEHCEITYKVHLDIENGNIKSGEFYKTNESATLTPHWQHNNIKWKFPEPAISATLKNVKLKKRWQNQSEKTSNDEITFQLQRKIKGQGDEEYKDIADKYIRKKIKDISNTEFTHTFNDLIPFNNNGEIYEYRVIEKGVPNGYDPIIDTDGEGNTDIINREIPVVKVKNKPNNVEFTKVSSIGQPLGGAIFKLQKEESTNTWKDVDRYKNITSNNLEAKIQMEKLAPGKYRLIETKAPEGFITPNNNQPVATFTVNKDGNIIDKKTNNDKNTIIINHPQAVDLTLFKYEGNESAQKPLRGATFKIYKNDSRPDKNNPTEEVIIKGVSEWMTNGDGEVTINGLTNGTYWLRETKPPKGYERIEGFIGKIIVKDGKLLYNKQPLYNDKGKSTQDNKIELKQNTLEIQNKKNYIELEKCYKDISGTEQPLNGAKFGLYKEVNNSYVQYLRENEHYIVSSGHTGEAGKFRFEKLEPGKYVVREEEAPLGFEKIDGNIITFTVKENGDYVDIENIQYNKISNNVCKIINKRKPMKFYIIKTDSNGLKLSDGILGVKIKDLKFNNGKDEKEFNLASDYEKYDSSRVQKEGLKIEVPVNTKSGTYTLKEIRAPQGFQLSNKEYKIRIDSENRRIELLGDKNSVKQVLYEENSNNSTIELGSPIEIKNKRVEYPNTGGIGTLLFTVIGGGLMAISSIFIMRKKRRI
nr:SpaA isopeptide-forming pilin-related protein [Peptostreptococcus canis]